MVHYEVVQCAVVLYFVFRRDEVVKAEVQRVERRPPRSS